LKRSTILWLVAVLVTLASVFWQGLSGPTHSLRISEDLAGATVSARLLRSGSTGSDLPVTIVRSSGEVTGQVHWRRYGTGEPWTTVPLTGTGDRLTAAIPAQPSAGKVEYSVKLHHRGQQLILPAAAAVARFKNDVPKLFLAPHVLLMFLGVLWSLRAGLEGLTAGPAQHRQAATTLALLTCGGLLFGPIVQKYAFGAFWTGWPLGEDLTDNKLAVAVLAWLGATVWSRRGPGRGRWLLVGAAVVTLAIYAIPHSLHGSTLDYQTMQTVSG